MATATTDEVPRARSATASAITPGGSGRWKQWRCSESGRRSVVACGGWPAGAAVQWCSRAGRGLDGGGASVRQRWIGKQWMAGENPR